MFREITNIGNVNPSLNGLQKDRDRLQLHVLGERYPDGMIDMNFATCNRYMELCVEATRSQDIGISLESMKVCHAKNDTTLQNLINAMRSFDDAIPQGAPTADQRDKIVAKATEALGSIQRIINSSTDTRINMEKLGRSDAPNANDTEYVERSGDGKIEIMGRIINTTPISPTELHKLVLSIRYIRDNPNDEANKVRLVATITSLEYMQDELLAENGKVADLSEIWAKQNEEILDACYKIMRISEEEMVKINEEINNVSERILFFTKTERRRSEEVKRLYGDI